MSTTRQRLSEWQKRMFILTAIALALCLKGAISQSQEFFQSYLFGFLFWFGIAFGSLGFTLIHGVTGGKWGDRISPLLESITGTLPLLAAFFIPVLLGFHSIFPWAQPGATDHGIMKAKAIYLNAPFFFIRAAFYWITWIAIVQIVLAARRAYRANPNTQTQTALHHRSAISLPIYVLTISFAFIDWIMSLDPLWFSSLFPGLVMVANGLGAMAFNLIMLQWVDPQRDGDPKLKLKSIHDLGNLMFAFTLLWAYLNFAQYLIIWSANIPEEITWFTHRAHGGWYVVSLLLVGFQFAVPFLFMLMKVNKQRIDRLRWVAALVFLMHFIDAAWTILPNFSEDGSFRLTPLNFLLPIAIGSLWFSYVLERLKAFESSFIFQAESQ